MKTTKIEQKVLTMEEQIAEWKKTYKKVFKAYIGDEEFIWRRITRKEYAAIMAHNEGSTMDERIYNREVLVAKMIVLNHSEEEMEELIEDQAGLATTLSEIVMEKSGFSASKIEEL